MWPLHGLRSPQISLYLAMVCCCLPRVVLNGLRVHVSVVGCPGEKWSLCFESYMIMGLTNVLKVGKEQDGSTWLREVGMSLAKEGFTSWDPSFCSEKWWYHYCLQNVGLKGRCSWQLFLEMYLSTAELINPQYAHSKWVYTLRGDCIWKAPLVQAFWCVWALNLKGCCRWTRDWRVEM